MNKESSIKQLKRIKQDMTHADDVNALDYAIRYMGCKELEQEPFKPMVEIDLYSVIKQKYIEREVLGKIRDEIDSHCSDNRDRNDGLYIAMKIIDKYKEG